MVQSIRVLCTNTVTNRMFTLSDLFDADERALQPLDIDIWESPSFVRNTIALYYIKRKRKNLRFLTNLDFSRITVIPTLPSFDGLNHDCVGDLSVWMVESNNYSNAKNILDSTVYSSIEDEKIRVSLGIRIGNSTDLCFEGLSSDYDLNDKLVEKSNIVMYDKIYNLPNVYDIAEEDKKGVKV